MGSNLAHESQTDEQLAAPPAAIGNLGAGGLAAACLHILPSTEHRNSYLTADRPSRKYSAIQAILCDMGSID